MAAPSRADATLAVLTADPSLAAKHRLDDLCDAVRDYITAHGGECGADVDISGTVAKYRDAAAGLLERADDRQGGDQDQQQQQQQGKGKGGDGSSDDDQDDQDDHQQQQRRKGGDAGGLLEDLLERIAESAEERIRDGGEEILQTLRDEAAKIQDRIQQPIHIEIPDSLKIETDAGDHPAMPVAARLLGALGKVLLVGPRGSGKTHLCLSLADRAGWRAGMQPMSEGVTEGDILGRINPMQPDIYVPSLAVELAESDDPSLMVWDEIDGADPNVALAMNAMTSNGVIPLPKRRTDPILHRRNHARFAATANTWGSGADMVYTGRNALDHASLDRWRCCQLYVGYSTALEESVTGRKRKGGAPMRQPIRDDLAALGVKAGDHWSDILWRIREKAPTPARREVSTRTFFEAATLEAAGFESLEILGIYLNDWTDSEIREALR